MWQALALMVIWVALSFAVSRYISRPLRAMSSAAQRIGLGNLDSPVRVHGTKEIATLGNYLEDGRNQLQTLYTGLEHLGQQRTQEMSTTNYQLEQETAERKRDQRQLGESLQQLENAYRQAIICGEDLQEEVAQRRRAEKELERSRDAALKASQAKSEFLAYMSHEIRTPINTIVGTADLLAEASLSPEQLEYIKVCRAAGDHLLHLIDDILDLTRVEAGRMDLENIDFDLVELVESTSTALAIHAHGKDIDLHCRIAPEVPTSVRGDPVRLRQILTNVMENAIKFTQQGEVVVDVCIDRAGDSSRCLLFQVSDTGPGIAKDKLDSIFDSFSQADSSNTRVYGGSGLGLTISKRLVEMMGGSICVRSELGKGSSFYFRVPFGGEPWSGQAGIHCHPELEGIRILIVDDSDSSRMILSELVAALGASTLEVADGYQALAELSRAKRSGEPYHLLLLDQEIPGIETLKAAISRKEGPGIVDTQVMLLTAGRQTASQDRVPSLRISQSIQKPVTRWRLLEAMLAALGLETKVRSDTTLVSICSEDTPQDNLRILFVEDSFDNRLLVEFYLKNLPYQLYNAENGEIAMEKFSSEKFDLVLMDMQMPVMDGYTATRAMRIWEREKEAVPTPIIALTAYALKEDAQRSLDAGCDGHLSKPIRKATLIDAIHQYAGKVPV